MQPPINQSSVMPGPSVWWLPEDFSLSSWADTSFWLAECFVPFEKKNKTGRISIYRIGRGIDSYVKPWNLKSHLWEISGAVLCSITNIQYYFSKQPSFLLVVQGAAKEIWSLIKMLPGPHMDETSWCLCTKELVVSLQFSGDRWLHQ